MKILIATDGSDYSERAIEKTCERLIRPDSQVVVVSVVEDAAPIVAEPFAVSAEYYQKIVDAVAVQCSTFVEEAARMIREHFPGEQLRIGTEVLRGSPANQIVEKAKEWGAEMIVVGSHGRGFWGRLLGSVSDGVVHHAPCSVLVVRS